MKLKTARRLPHGSRFDVSYDATEECWAGVLHVPEPPGPLLSGRSQSFFGKAKGVFGLLAKLDRAYVKTLPRPPCGHCGHAIKHPVSCFGCQVCEFRRDHYICLEYTTAPHTPENCEICRRGAGTSTAPHFTCPSCARVTYNPSDIEHRYCGACHRFFTAEVPP